jgi:uncharacterized protein (TIGR00251 family)
VEGTRVRIRVAPGAKRTAVVGRHGAGWKVRVAAPPEAGRANDALVQLLADTLAVPQSSVRLVSGHGARDKIVELAGMDTAQVEDRLTSVAERDSQ